MKESNVSKAVEIIKVMVVKDIVLAQKSQCLYDHGL
jgi:hypothetical protein